jgi:hypothetical protein
MLIKAATDNAKNTELVGDFKTCQIPFTAGGAPGPGASKPIDEITSTVPDITTISIDNNTINSQIFATMEICALIF